MRWALTAVFLFLVSLPLRADEPLPSRDVVLPTFQVPAIEPMDFDLIDLRADERIPDSHRVDVERYARNLERDIRESPWDWLWPQKKWKIKRPTVSAEPTPKRAVAP